MKKSIFICLFLCCGLSYANDSLVRLIDTTKSVEKKLIALNSLAWSYRSNNHHAADSIANVALKLAKEHDNDREYANALNTLGVLDLMQGRLHEGTKKINECAEINWKIKSYKAYLDNKMNIGLTYYFKGQLDSAANMMWALYHLADSLNELAINKQLLHNLSSIYNSQGKYVESLEVAFKSLDNAIKQGDESEVSKTYNSIGLIYDYLGNLEKAKYYHLKSLNINLEDNDTDGLSSSYGNLGELYRQEGQWDSAFFCYQKALDYSNQLNDSASIAGQMMNLALYYDHFEQYDSARNIIETALDLSLRNDYGYQATLGENMLGMNLLSSGRIREAVPYLLNSLKVSMEYGIVDVVQANYDGLYQTYKKLNKSDSAVYYLEKWIHLKDSLTNLKAKEKVEWLETEYRTAEKEKKIALLNEHQSRNELKISKQYNWILALVGFIIAIVLATLILIQITKRKNQAEKDAAIIRERDKGTQAVFLAQEEERKRISKELHDGIGQQLSGVKMAFQRLSKSISNSNPELFDQTEKLSELVTETADDVRAISHQMMPKSLIELGLIEALEDMLKKSLGINNIQYDFEHLGITQRLDEKIEISVYRVAQELVNNIVKHSGSTKVSLQLFKNRGKLIFVVEDNGKGIGENKGDGHGLLNMKSRINALNGELNLEPSPNSGTLATIRIPIE